MNLRLASLALPFVGLVVFAACNGEMRFDQPASSDAGDTTTADDADVDSGTPAAPPCTDDSTCTPLGMRCHTPSGRCVACLTSSECPSARPRCDATLHVCVECSDNLECGGFDHTVCDVTTHRCLRTCTDDPCPSDLICDDQTRLCIECANSGNCASYSGKYCDTTIGQCVECAGNAQCPAERPRCDRRNGKCVGCVASSECPAGQACSPTSLTCVVP